MTLSTFGASAASFGAAGLLQYLAFQRNQDFDCGAGHFSKDIHSQSQTYIDLQNQGQGFEQGSNKFVSISGGVTLVSGIVMSSSPIGWDTVRTTPKTKMPLGMKKPFRPYLLGLPCLSGYWERRALRWPRIHYP